MKKTRKNRAQKPIQQLRVATDVTLSDYANCAKVCNRTRKGDRLSSARTLRKSESGEELADQSRSPSPTGTTDHRRPAAVRSASRADGAFTQQFPEILFYLLSQYIYPKDIGRFALVCRAAHAQTRRGQLWKCLYERFCAPYAALLPSHLHLDIYRLRPHALRYRVVCALHHVYPPFLKNTEGSVQRVRGWRCVEFWDRKDSTGGWLYCFKLKHPLTAADERAPVNGVFANSQLSCVALLAQCREQQVVLEPCGGLRVVDVRVSLHSSAGSERTLHLGLARVAHMSAAATALDLSVSLHTVRKLEVVDWWDRRYPFSDVPPRAHGDRS